MSKWHDFLVEHAKFPFPHPYELGSVGSTDISEFEAELLKPEWKAKHAVRDDTLVHKLCDTLKNILGDTLLAADVEDDLLACFSPKLGAGKRGYADKAWSRNPSEVQSRSLLDKGFFVAAGTCLWEYGQYDFQDAKEDLVEGASSKVDYVALVDGESKVLCEAKSPSVMKKVGELLPARGFELKWVRGQPLVPKILAKSALYLGLRQMEWLFLSCHNYWIVCRLVRDDNRPFLAYSPMISIEDSSEPFRAFLGAILSGIKDIPVGPSALDPDMELDIIVEEEDEGSSPEDDSDDGSGAYPGNPSKGPATDPPITRGRKRAGGENTESGLMVTSSSPASFPVWVHLDTFPNNTFALPQCVGSRKPRLWLTRFVASGSTGNVWQCHFDESDDSFAIKIVEMLRRSDADSRQRLRNEFNVYLTLEEAYRSGKLRDRITPHCYGAFEGDGVDVLILDLCDGILNAWDELNTSERSQVYKLVRDLHSIGIMHGDLEPRNVVRAREGGLRLIDFSESTRHICKESEVETHTTSVQNKMCSELQTLHNLLMKPQLKPSL